MPAVAVTIGVPAPPVPGKVTSVVVPLSHSTCAVKLAGRVTTGGSGRTVLTRAREPVWTGTPEKSLVIFTRTLVLAAIVTPVVSAPAGL